MTQKEKNEIPGEPANPAHRLAKRLQENRESLHIARVPPTTKKEFIEWADKEFCGDYGMALKWLWDGIPKGDLLSVLEVVQDHEARIIALESKKEVIKPIEEKTNKKTIKMVDGTKKEVPNNE